MKNPFSEESKNQRQLNKEIKAEGLDKKDINDLILEDADQENNFSEFLTEINPQFGNLDLQDKQVQKMVREKYILFRQYKEEQPKLETLYKGEIAEELGIEIPADKQQEAFGEMEGALRKMAQTETLKFQELKGKIAEFQKLREELKVLEEKFEQKVGLKGKEAVQAMGDRQKRMEIAEEKFNVSGSGFGENLARGFKRGMAMKDIPWHKAGYTKEVENLTADFKETFQLDGEALEADMKESSGDLKKAKELKEKVDSLRNYFLNELKLGQKLIETAKVVARDTVRASAAEGMGGTGPERLDTVSKADRVALKAMLQPRITGFRQGLSESEQADYDMIDDLDTMEVLNSRPKESLSTDEKTKLERLQKEKMARGIKRIDALEKARALSAKMMEGKGKKGGVDYTKNFVDSTGNRVDITATNSHGVEVPIDTGLEAELEALIKGEVRQVIEEAAFNSKRIGQFTEQVGDYLDKWRIGGMDTRSKVQEFIGKTLEGLSHDTAVHPALKVQLKAYMAKRGVNPLKFNV